MLVGVCVCGGVNTRMPDCLASEKIPMPGPVRYETKPMQSGIFLVRYRTEFMDAGMPMPAFVFSMPMPSYACITEMLKKCPLI